MFRFALALFLTLAFLPYVVHAEDGDAMRRLSVQLQSELARVGCSPGEIDGHWGNNSYLAIKAYNKATGEKLRLYKPSQQALDSVKEKSGQVCSSAPVIKKQNVKPVTRPINRHPYDGLYQITGERIQNKKKVFCSETFEIKFKVQNGQTNHKIPLGHLLRGQVKGNRLHISSQAERSGGHWVGLFALGAKKDAVTIGTFKWIGAENGATCAYQAIIRRL